MNINEIFKFFLLNEINCETLLTFSGVFQIISAKKEAGLYKTEKSQGRESSIYYQAHSLPTPEAPDSLHQP